MISAIWGLCMIAGVAMLLAACSKQRVEHWFAPAIALMIMLLYLFALAGRLDWGCAAIRVLGVGCMAPAAALCARSRESRRAVLTPGLMCFAVAVLAAGWAHRGQVYVLYDEFNHWGRAVNRMYAYRGLANAIPGALDYPSYPPAATLWEYLWTWLGGGFSEGGTISANGVWIAAFFFPLLRYADWKHWKRILPMLLIAIMLPLPFFAGAYQNLYVDVVLGAAVSYVLIQWFTLPRSRWRTAMICAGMLTLPLVKESGTFLALIALGLMALDAWREERGGATLRALALPSLCLVASLVSWKLFLSVNGIVSEKPFRFQEIGENLRMFLQGGSPWYQQYAVANFFRYLTLPEMIGSGHILQPCYLEWLMLLGLCACWLGRGKLPDGTPSPGAARRGRAAFAMLVSTVVYAVALLHLYLYAFSHKEAASLHSFDRYMASVMIPALALTLALMLEAWEKNPPRIFPACLIALALMMLVVNPSALTELSVAASHQIEATQSKRSAYYPPAWVLEKTSSEKPIAWIASGRNDPDMFLAYLSNRYEFMPAQLESPCGSQLTDTPENVLAALVEGGYEYVYCYDADEQFIQEYGSLFESPEEIADKTLYRLAQGSGRLQLQRVD